MGRNANTINTFPNSNLVVILVSAISKLCFDIKFSEQKLFFSLLPSCTKQSKLAWPIWPWGVLICYEEYNENIFDMINKKCYFGSFKKRLSLRGWSFQWTAQLQELLKLTGMIVGLGFASCMTVAKEKLTDGDGGLVSSFRSHHNLSGGRNIWWRINDSQNARSTNLLLTFAFCSFLNISMILCIINAPMKFLLLPQTQFYDFLCNLRFTSIHTY